MRPLVLAVSLVVFAGCRARPPVYEYEPTVTTVTGGVEVPPGVEVPARGLPATAATSTTTTSSTLPRPLIWQGPKRW